MKDLARHHGKSIEVVKDRLRAGWTLKKALTVPVRAYTHYAEKG